MEGYPSRRCALGSQGSRSSLKEAPRYLGFEGRWWGALKVLWARLQLSDGISQFLHSLTPYLVTSLSLLLLIFCKSSSFVAKGKASQDDCGSSLAAAQALGSNFVVYIYGHVHFAKLKKMVPVWAFHCQVKWSDSLHSGSYAWNTTFEMVWWSLDQLASCHKSTMGK